MSSVRFPKHAFDLLAGRWQIPLALIAAIIAGTTLHRLIPSLPQMNYDALLADATALEQAENTLAAADAITELLERTPALPPARQAALHARLADLIFRAERGLPKHNINNVKKLLAHERSARTLGQPRSPSAVLREAFASEWLGDDDAALKGFQSALDLDLPADDRRVCLRALAQLLERRPEASRERREVLERLLGDESVSQAHLWWGLEQAVQDALDDNDPLQARALLARYGDRLKSSDLKGYLEYLWACVMLHEGRAEEAAPLVRWIDDWLGQEARASSELDSFEHLPSLNRWLRGRIDLAEGRPQDALAAFDEVLEYRPAPELRVAAGIGRGLALAALDRHPTALEAFRGALAEGALAPNRRRVVNDFQRALLGLFEGQRTRGEYGNAAEYLAAAAELIPNDQPARQRDLFEQLGETCRALAESTADADVQRNAHARAGRSFERAADLATFDEPRQAELLWSSAGAYDRAQRLADGCRMLQRFVQGRSDHPRMPQALLQLGQAYESFGEPNEALAWYGRVSADYPRLGEAASAKVLRAGVLLSLGPERCAEAEQMLVDLLTSGHVAPDAAVYRDALLRLCELLDHEGRDGDAISRWEDFLRLYPEDPERLRVRFMLADAYRRSAYALRDDPPVGVAEPTAAAESRARFRRAAELYGELMHDLDAGGERDMASQLYARLALFNRGDCLFELNEPDTLAEALDMYRSAAVCYEGQPAAVAAQVQIANVFLRQGEVAQAARAVKLAQWLLGSVPAGDFTRLTGSTRADWEKFLSVVSASDLFRDAFASNP